LHSTPISRKRFEALLIETRNGAMLNVTTMVPGREEGTRGDARAA
jgi:hypothetical protein